MAAVEKAHRDGADAVLFGRVTFEQMAGYWPHQENDTTSVTGYLNTTHKYVVSRTLTDPWLAEATPFRSGIVLMRYRRA